ncbi:MAG: thermonuclease family protein [Candidatus Paceibacterota bacterium]
MSSIPADVLSRANAIGFFGVLILLIAYFFEGPPLGLFDIGKHLPSQEIPTYYQVTKVTDGDTIHVNIEGADEVIRLIGINTPETVDPRRPVQCFGKEASARMKELVGGKIVRLEYDDSQSLRDTYNRLLAYVYLEDGEMINRKMIAEGYAYEYTYMTPYKYQREFRELQTLARTSARGLWAPETCNGSKTLSK